MINPTIDNSIQDKQLLTFYYDLEPRVVEPHAYGRTAKGKNVLRAWQTSGNKPGWRLFLESGMSVIAKSPDTFQATRPDYERGDSSMEEIYRQL